MPLKKLTVDDIGVQVGDIPALQDVDGVPGLPAVSGALLTDLPSGSGDVVGPASAVSANISVFDGTTGKLIADSGYSIADLLAYSSILYEAIFGACWGDSETFGTGSTFGGYPYALSALVAMPFYNGGVGGETSTQIRTRMIADTARYSNTTCIWAGRNNYTDGATVQADIAAMVAALGHDRYLVFGILNSVTEISGTVAHGQIVALNAALATTYGARFVDMRDYIINDALAVMGITPTPTDLANIANDVPPDSLRSDTIHLNNNGYTAIAKKVYSYWFAGLELIKSIGEMLASYGQIGGVTPGEVKATKFTIGTHSIYAAGNGQLQITGDWYPAAPGTYDLGLPSLGWRDVSLTRVLTLAGKQINAAGNGNLQVSSSWYPASDNVHSLGIGALRWLDGWFSGTVYIGDNTKYITGSSNGNLQTNASLYPATDNLYSLGIGSNRWLDLWAAGTVYIGTNTKYITGTANGNLQTNASLYPATDNTYSLGIGSNRWVDGWFAGTVYVGPNTKYIAGSGDGQLQVNAAWYPATNDAHKLGLDSLRWSEVNTNILFLNGILINKAGTGDLQINEDVTPAASATFDLGTTSQRWRAGIFSSYVQIGNTSLLSGAGSPEGVKVGSVGDTYSDSSGGGTYYKATGNGTNTGWVLSSNATHTGDATGATALTLATVNSNVGSFGSATQSVTLTVNGKGLVTAASVNTITPAVGNITGLGAGVATALAINIGSAGAPITYNGDAGTPSALVGTNISGTAASLTAGLVTSIGSLTGDVTSSNRATTLATVNSNVGSFTNANITVNAKGLITAASSGTAVAPGGSTTQIQLNNAGAFGGVSGLTANLTTGAVTQTQTALGATTAAGFTLVNTTAATNGTQQVSPANVLQGSGYGTTGSAAQTVAFREYVLPVQGTTAPTGGLTIQSIINAGTPKTVFSLSDTGTLSVGDASGFAITAFNILNGSGTPGIGVNGTKAIGFETGRVSALAWGLTGTVGTSSDTVFARTAAGVAELNSGTTSACRDLRLSHVLAGGTAPTISAGAGAGTSPTVTVVSGSQDMAGQLSIVTGTTPTGSAVIATITFNRAFPTGAWPVISPANAAAAGVGANGVFAIGASTTTWTLNSTAVGLTGATTYLWNYSVKGY